MTRITNFIRLAACLGGLALLTGCDQPQITVYRVPKPRAAWQLPEGWKPVEARIGVASFSIATADGKEAQVNLTPLPPMAGRDAMIVNMWRTQVGLPEISESEAAAQLSAVVVGGDQGRLFEVANKPADRESPQRIVTAIVHRSDVSWFYKLSGDDAVVVAEKPRFLEFLKSIKPDQLPQPKRPSMTAPVADDRPAAASRPAPRFNWKVPAGWQIVPAGNMQAAKFALPEAGGAKADVTVSIFPSDTGGQLANINRWRGQLGLPGVSAAELPKLVTPLDPKNPQAILVDLSNNGRRMVGGIVPRGGQWFFYKLLGDDAAVASQKDAFVEFVKSEP